MHVIYWFAGSCSAAGYSSCCESGLCKGEPPNCYCDGLCHFFYDCCLANVLCQINNIASGITENQNITITLYMYIHANVHEFNPMLKLHKYSSNRQERMKFWSVYMALWQLCTGPTVFDFIMRPNNLTTSQSSRVKFQCTVRSTLIPNFAWNFTRKGSTEGETIANRSGVLSADYYINAGRRRQVLIITNVHWRHEGVYTCIVSSRKSQIQAEASLNVPSECMVQVRYVKFLFA